MQNLFLKIDLFISNITDEIKNNSNYLNFVEAVNSLEDPLPKIVFHSINYTILFIPIILIAVIINSNTRVHKQLNLKKDIVKTILKLEKVQNKNLVLIRSKTSSSPIYKRIQLLNMLEQMERLSNIDRKNVEIKSFVTHKFTAQIILVEASIAIKKFTTVNLTNLTKNLFNKQKVYVSKINLTKSKNNKFIEGVLNLKFLSRVSVKN